ncbi:MAG: protein translocase subunit SecF [Patescibacteria group bacterium]|nr:protein translocase subunit SecF [Patescibacteria group bacterium]
MFIVRYKSIFFALSAMLMGASLFAILFFGLNLGIDFKGGALLEVSYPNGRPEIQTIEEGIKSIGLGNTTIQPAGENSIILRTKDLSGEERMGVLNVLSLGGTTVFEEERFNSIGPVIGSELKRKAVIAIIIVMVAIILFITFAFRRVSLPVPSWKYGLVAIIALLHDVIIPTGVFALLGNFFIDFQINVLFVTALLAILGFSVHDTIVVFDRIRENLRRNKEYHIDKEFAETVGEGLSQTFTRSINTSMTVVFVMLILYFLGGEPTRQFALALSVGVIAGTYSSLFIASPLLVVIEKWQRR